MAGASQPINFPEHVENQLGQLNQQQHDDNMETLDDAIGAITDDEDRSDGDDSGSGDGGASSEPPNTETEEPEQESLAAIAYRAERAGDRTCNDKSRRQLEREFRMLEREMVAKRITRGSYHGEYMVTLLEIVAHHIQDICPGYNALKFYMAPKAERLVISTCQLLMHMLEGVDHDTHYAVMFLGFYANLLIDLSRDAWYMQAVTMLRHMAWMGDGVDGLKVEKQLPSVLIHHILRKIEWD